MASKPMEMAQGTKVVWGLVTLETLQIHLGMVPFKSTYRGQSQSTIHPSLGVSMGLFQVPSDHNSCGTAKFTSHPGTKVWLRWSNPVNQYLKRSSTTPVVIPAKMNLFG